MKEWEKHGLLVDTLILPTHVPTLSICQHNNVKITTDVVGRRNIKVKTALIK